MNERRTLARWLARPRPKPARCLLVTLDGEPHARLDGEIEALAVASDVITDAEERAESSGESCTVVVTWLGPSDRELVHCTVVVGDATGSARLDGSPHANAVNAQRHVEAMARLMVAHTQSIERSWRELAEAQQRARLEAEREARELRAELRAKRDELDGIDPDDRRPSALDGVVEQLLPAMLARMPVAPAAAPASAPDPNQTEQAL